MSRLTSAFPFNKTSPYEQSAPTGASTRHAVPLSPPETEQGLQPLTAEQIELLSMRQIQSDAGASIESPARFRKLSSLSYNQSTLREQRQPVKRVKWLIIVLPPPSISQEPAMLGHTLSTSPASRFSSGILMPLFPTLYAQLTAIAKEFNMPSTTGLCLYFHVSQPTLSIKPRISDDTWQYLWSHLLDDSTSPSPSQGPPIGGTIEFDVDVRKAKWYGMWMGISRRSELEVPVMLNHSRRASQVSSEHQSDMAADVELLETASLPRVTPSHQIRRVPRPLSLVERDSEQTGRASLGVHLNHRHVLSPVPQSADPVTANGQDLVSRVTNWRDVTSVSPAIHPLAHIGQMSLDPANMPNSLPQSPVLLNQFASNPSTGVSKENVKEDGNELDLNDFAWSISSVGPQSTTVTEMLWPSPLPSVDLPRRVEGSVCLSPSIVTSFGPDDSDEPDESYPYLDYLPSPDLAHRALSDAPCTPTTATSWGAPSCCLSCPASPTRVRTPDLGERSSDHVYRGGDSHPFGSFPYYDAWNRQPWSHVWPYTEYRRDAQNVLHQKLSEVVTTRQIATEQAMLGLDVGLPKDSEARVVVAQTVVQVMLPTSYPFINLYPSVYPYIEVYAAKSLDTSVLTSAADDLDCSLQYPCIELYPACYPHVIPYPQLTWLSDTILHSIPIISMAAFYSPSEGYPTIEPYPAREFSKLLTSQFTVAGSNDCLTDYPTLQIYPPLVSWSVEEVNCVDMGNVSDDNLLPDYYPTIVVYPAVYPHIEIYPQSQAITSTDLEVDLAPLYPEIILYPVTYPHLMPYRDLVIHKGSTNFRDPTACLSVAEYPFIYIYDLILPFLSVTVTTISTTVQSVYPNMEIYPPVYPHLAPYPNCGLSTICLTVSEYDNMEIALPSNYPYVQPYPPAYPLIELYPTSALQDTCLSLLAAKDGSLLEAYPPSHYPHIELYPPVYPFIEVYPKLSGERQTILAPVTGIYSMETDLTATYPFVKPYPHAYPFIEPYPSVFVERMTSLPTRVARNFENYLETKYPYIQPYPPVYPSIEPYPCFLQETKSAYPHERLIPHYPYFRVYEPVYPFIEPYPIMSATGGKTRLKHIDLHHIVFGTTQLDPKKFTHAQLHDTAFASQER